MVKPVLLLILIFSLFFLGCIKQKELTAIGFENVTVNAEIADTPEERSVGLMHRTKMDPTSGMLFVFEEENKHIFWMKNTLIALDMIFISKDFEIVDIVTALPCQKDPCRTYEPKEKALFVLEVNKGFSEAKGVKIGQKVNISIE